MVGRGNTTWCRGSAASPSVAGVAAPWRLTRLLLPFRHVILLPLLLRHVVILLLLLLRHGFILLLLLLLVLPSFRSSDPVFQVVRKIPHRLQMRVH